MFSLRGCMRFACKAYNLYGVYVGDAIDDRASGYPMVASRLTFGYQVL